MKENQSLSEVAELLAKGQEPAFVVDPDGCIVLWNPAAEAFLGVSAGDVGHEPIGGRFGLRSQDHECFGHLTGLGVRWGSPPHRPRQGA